LPWQRVSTNEKPFRFYADHFSLDRLAENIQPTQADLYRHLLARKSSPPFPCPVAANWRSPPFKINQIPPPPSPYLPWLASATPPDTGHPGKSIPGYRPGA
jgi:hypothetical protein